MLLDGEPINKIKKVAKKTKIKHNSAKPKFKKGQN